ncbi:MAG: hypothetical protein WCF85_16610 [Rhodospirillaceae bacterium]
MLERFADSSLRNEPAEGRRIRMTDETTSRRLWIAADQMTRRMADMCLLGGAIGNTALISAPVRRVPSAAGNQPV